MCLPFNYAFKISYSMPPPKSTFYGFKIWVTCKLKEEKNMWAYFILYSKRCKVQVTFNILIWHIKSFAVSLPKLPACPFKYFVMYTSLFVKTYLQCMYWSISRFNYAVYIYQNSVMRTDVVDVGIWHLDMIFALKNSLI